MRILAIDVRRNELNHMRVDIPPHELPVLAYVHGEAACILLGELEIEDRPELLDGNSEYTRLAQKYGRDKANESLEPRVAAVFGNGMRGVAALQEAIDYGQRKDLPTSAFALQVNEASHETPTNRLTPMQKTQIQPLAHGQTGSEKGSNAVPAPQTREGRRAPDVHEIPSALLAGAQEAKRETSVRGKRRAASGTK